MQAASFLNLEPTANRAALSSDVVEVDGWAFLSGVSPIDLHDDRKLIPELVEDQTRKIFANLEELLGKSGLKLKDIVSVRIYVTQYKRFHERLDRTYAKIIGDLRPARSVVGVSELPRGALVQMDFVVRRGVK
jgi:enamine deaminase RidA (YjgF/YER057c/UK114 family)